MDLIKIVKAEGADDYVSPTIPFIPPTVEATPPITGIADNNPSISLVTEVPNGEIVRGNKATIKVKLFTNRIDINNFKFKIKYNADLFEIVDGDAKKSGVQLPYKNTFFVEQTQNRVYGAGNEGYIEFAAGAKNNGTATVTNGTILEFEVKALKLGSGSFVIDKKESALNTLPVDNSSNENILKTTKDVVLNVVVSTSSNNNNNNGLTGVPIVSRTPRTALGDDPMEIVSIITGVILILSGIYLNKKRKNNSHAIQR